MEAKLNFKASIVVMVFIFVGLGVRMATYSASSDPLLEKAVRDVIWSTYSGIHLSSEIDKIREERDYENIEALTKKSTPKAISIEQISRSEPLLALSSSQIVIIRVRYRFPGESSTRTEYMEFKHGNLVDVWSYNYEVSAISYYLNFF